MGEIGKYIPLIQQKLSEARDYISKCVKRSALSMQYWNIKILLLRHCSKNSLLLI